MTVFKKGLVFPPSSDDDDDEDDDDNHNNSLCSTNFITHRYQLIVLNIRSQKTKVSGSSVRNIGQ